MAAPRVPYGSTFMMRCPVDGLPLRTTQPDLVGDLARDASQIGGHLHVEFGESGTCPNGHKWRLYGDLLLEREG